MTQANNIVMLVGRVGATPEMKYVNQDPNKAFTRFNLAVNRPIKDSQGNYITDWFTCEFWGRQAELAAEMIKKGSLVSVVGSGRIDNWNDKQTNEKRSRFFVYGSSFQLLSPRSESENENSQSVNNKSVDDFSDYVVDDAPPF
ncbi:MAG: single-stranded DNA-binding protein [Candidatus Sericytochromatia bacterium]|nr:MAG: single-stranded DNA-binding protein [Candidatus Sericytochromatia bacterium]